MNQTKCVKVLPSFDYNSCDGQREKPSILVLEIKHRDRPNEMTIGWVLVERVEHQRDSDGSIYEASIHLSYQQIKTNSSPRDVGKGRFDGSYSRISNSVSLTSSSTVSGGGVFLDPPELRGHRLGTYLMNEIVQWVKQWPEATVNSVVVLEAQAMDDNKVRRNRFYEQFGLEFDYTSLECQEGRSRPMLVGALATVETWKQSIVEHKILAYLEDVLNAERRASSELEARERTCQILIAERRQAEEHPVRWVLKQLYCRYASMVIAGAILAILMGIAWIKIK